MSAQQIEPIDEWIDQTAVVYRDLRQRLSSASGTKSRSLAVGDDTSAVESDMRVFQIALVIVKEARYMPLSKAEARDIRRFLDIATR